MPTDTPEKLNYEKMAAMANYLLNLIVNCARADFQICLPDYDSTPTELEYINNVFSDLLLQFGLPELKSREDIDRVVRMMTATYGL